MQKLVLNSENSIRNKCSTDSKFRKAKLKNGRRIDTLIGECETVPKRTKSGPLADKQADLVNEPCLLMPIEDRTTLAVVASILKNSAKYKQTKFN